jgi:hypothetical protein
LVFDSARGKIVMFGGYNATALDDTWEFDGTNWVERVLPTRPPGRSYHAMAFDAVRGKVIVVAGNSGTTTTLADSWEFDGSQWTQQPVTKFVGRTASALAFDPVRHKLVLFGGIETNVGLADTWERSFVAPGALVENCVAGIDADGDGLVACGDPLQASLDGIRSPGADPDCNARCYPLCPITTPASLCDPSAPHCGDHVCNQDLEDHMLCPVDCN